MKATFHSGPKTNKAILILKKASYYNWLEKTVPLWINFGNECVIVDKLWINMPITGINL